ncbi:MAG: NADH-quinone oxidoreductase subunit C [Planctomycetota bacterium]|nr:MAG: NADH-quinone oxidoreductase subunit C [Planctomycetota bacterium]
MTPESICNILKDRFGGVIEDAVLEGARPYALIRQGDNGRWPEVARFLRDDPRLGFNLLRCITALDLLADNKLACVYDFLRVADDGGDALIQPKQTWIFAVRLVTDRDAPSLPSVADVWPAADWHEREAYDLMGVVFDGHPDLRRILCPDDWEGHPLRKDYAYPMEYHGIPGTTEYELTNPYH